jgi:hypothetical protein
MLDVAAAAAHLRAAPLVTLQPLPANLPGSSTHALVAVASSPANHDPATLTWRWTQRAGATASIADADRPTARITLPPGRGQLVVEVAVTDPDDQTTRANLLIDVNNAPQASPAGVARTTVGERVDLALAATDLDGDGIRYALVEGRPDMTIDPRSGRFAWVATTEGDFPVVVSITDAYGARGDDVAFSIAVAPALATNASSVPMAERADGAGSGGGGAAGPIELLVLGVLACVGLTTRRRR